MNSPKVCEWSFDDDSALYTTGCEDRQRELMFNENFDNKRDPDYKFCPYCGKRIDCDDDAERGE